MKNELKTCAGVTAPEMKEAATTELVFILDRSGSMHGLEKDTIGGFNSMLDEQKKKDGAVLVTTVLFDTDYEILHDRLPLEKVPDMTEDDYRVGSCTALLDAIGRTVEHVSDIHKYARPEDVPEKTLFVITTDGLENASRKFTAGRIKRMIEEKKSEYGWEFLFLGANMDAITTASSIGIDTDRAVTFCSDSVGTAVNYKSVSKAVLGLRTSREIDSSWKEDIEADVKRRGKR